MNKMLFLIIISLLLTGCNLQNNLEDSKQQSIPIDINYIKSEKQPEPPKLYNFSRETREYVKNYCGFEIEDIKYTPKKIEKIEESNIKENQQANKYDFQIVETEITNENEINTKYIQEIFERLPFEKVDDSIDIWVSIFDLNLEYHIKKEGFGILVEQKKEPTAAIRLITDKDVIIKLHKSVDVCSKLKEYTSDKSLITADHSLSNLDLLMKTGDLKDCISIS